MFIDFGKKNTLGKLVTMATKKRLSPIFELENSANRVKHFSLPIFKVKLWAKP